MSWATRAQDSTGGEVTCEEVLLVLDQYDDTTTTPPLTTNQSHIQELEMYNNEFKIDE